MPSYSLAQPTYAYSLHSGTRVAHLGTADNIVCGTVLRTFVATSAKRPAGLRLCKACGARAGRDLPAASGRGAAAQRDALFARLVAEGLTNEAIARRLGIGLRTVVTHITGAMNRAGARNRFAWGYTLGYAAGLRDATRRVG